MFFIDLFFYIYFAFKSIAGSLENVPKCFGVFVWNRLYSNRCSSDTLLPS